LDGRRHTQFRDSTKTDYPIYVLPPVYPATPAEMADALREAIRRNRRVSLGGNSSKRLMAGMAPPADAEIWTCELNRVTGLRAPRSHDQRGGRACRGRKLTNVLAANRQMVPLDPPFAERATVGGVVASNVSGPRRRLFGTRARQRDRDAIRHARWQSGAGQAAWW